jgi:hypothetical protein
MNVDTLDLKRGNTQREERKTPKREDSDRDNADFISIIDRMLFNSPSGPRIIL